MQTVILWIVVLLALTAVLLALVYFSIGAVIRIVWNELSALPGPDDDND